MNEILSFDDYVNEMAYKFGDSNSIIMIEKNRKYWFETTKNLPIYKKYNNDIITHFNVDSNKTFIYTNDYNNKETIHIAKIVNIKNDNFKFEYNVQDTVDRVKDGVLPRRYATDFIYDYFVKSNVPLRSSAIQYDTGHNMWRRLVDKALNDDYYAFYYDSKKLLRINDVNKEKYLKSYYSDADKSFENKHIFISKKLLNGDLK